MNDGETAADVWKTDRTVDVVSSEEARNAFAQEVINRVHQRILVHDFLLLVAMGFVGILLGFLNSARGGESS